MNNFLTYTLADEFEELYKNFRASEGRLYSDVEVLLLPKIRKTHQHSDEWGIRKNSLKRLTTYLKHKGNEFNLLEVGCGNGWLSAQLAKHTMGKVVGIDVNRMDIEQAKKVFHQIANIEFMQGDLYSEILQDEKFDFIVFSASIEYFSSLKNIIATAFKYITLQGEIHIIDSYFYKQKEIAAATQSTKEHFSDVGFEAMSSFYFHHSIEDLKKFYPLILYNPAAWNNILISNHNPFHHVIIKNRYQ